jgi:hypothetical protein
MRVEIVREPPWHAWLDIDVCCSNQCRIAFAVALGDFRTAAGWMEQPVKALPAGAFRKLTGG